MQLYSRHRIKYEVSAVDRVDMKVGALSQHVTGPHNYAFTWSPIGVATEYVKDAIIAKDGKEQTIAALSHVEQHVINGHHYEDNYTSGGAADLPEALAATANYVAYKTLRYPGHYEWVRGQLADIGDVPDKIAVLEERMLSQIPLVEDDVVVIYAAVSSRDQHGFLRKTEHSHHILPSQVGNHMLRAIQTTTAAPLCEMAHYVLHQDVSGVVLQSEIDPDAFMSGPFVSAIYGG